ncbi:MAG: bifunctional methylenetetrahydrofolate dehydrogenase/methenyltetrahydrofolate cyclohydrolase FolD [Sphingomonas sp.]|nr:bifunctional methylenetetrahydrofolate dehydrogenase/methenyltetrahydrofolate cyclohydrolase FolD [Sphingomonas sp.]
MAARIIDGMAIARKLREQVAEEVAALPRIPGLAVVLVGNDPASEIYVRNKVRAARSAQIYSVEHRLPANASEPQILALIRRLNGDPHVDGILVQLPLPPGIDALKVIEAIDPLKDVDGFHPYNVGRLAAGAPAMVPCTPLGAMMLIHEAIGVPEGIETLMIGCSNIVGKPLAQLLLADGATVTMAHKLTSDLAEHVARADLLVAAAGVPGLVRGAWIRPGATVIDIGINRIADGQGGSRIVGDVVYDEACEVAGAITPVPGGVGPMTIACLLKNTLQACRQHGQQSEAA